MPIDKEAKNSFDTQVGFTNFTLKFLFKFTVFLQISLQGVQIA
jgi:hypothetical protein